MASLHSNADSGTDVDALMASLHSNDDSGTDMDLDILPSAAAGIAAAPPPSAADGAAAAAGGEFWDVFERRAAGAAPAHIPLPTTTISLHHDEPAVVPHSAAAVPCSATAAVDLTDFNKVNDVLLANMGGIDGLLAAPAVPATAVAFDTLRSDDASNTLALLPAACDADGADAASPACDAPLADGADASPLSPTAVQLRLWRPTFVKGTAEPPMPLATREEYRAEAAVMGAAIAAAQALERQAKAAAAAVPLGATKKAAAAAKRAAKAAAVEVVNVRGKLSALLRAV